MTIEELIQELKPLLKDIADYGNEYFEKHCEDVFKVIISREKLLLEKIGKVLREYKVKTIADYDKTYGCDPLEWGICDGEKAIDSCLAIIEKESKQ